MTAAEQKLWEATQRRASRLSPSMGLAILAAFAIIRNAMSEEDMARAIERGGAEAFVGELMRQVVLASAWAPARERMRSALVESARYSMRTIPLPPRVTPAQIRVAFDSLSPNVIAAIRKLETQVITDLTNDVREFVRVFVENGLRDGVGPKVIARQLRPFIGMPASREVWVTGYEAALRGGPRASVFADALQYELRDKRFDMAVKAAMRDGAKLSEAQIEKMVGAFRRKTIAFNADAVARTATLDALKQGQRLSWLAAADAGYVNALLVKRRWTGVMDARERPEHVAMEGDVASLDEPHRNGQIVPGDSEYGCRCIDAYFIAAA